MVCIVCSGIDQPPVSVRSETHVGILRSVSYHRLEKKLERRSGKKQIDRWLAQSRIWLTYM